MKHTFSILLVLIISLFLSSCFENSKSPEIDEDQTPEITTEKEPKELVDDEIGSPIIEEEYSSGDIVLYDFGSMMSLTSGTTLTGKAPRKWFFEGIFPVVLMTPSEEVIAEALATGAWLEPVLGSDELGADDMVEFDVTLNFVVPEDSEGEAKLRFIFQDMSGETEGVYVEELVILSE